MNRIATGFACLLWLASCAISPPVPPQVRTDLAPTGKLRAGINYANSVIATKDPVTGELRGVSVDLMREIARRLEVPLELVGFDFSGKMADALSAHLAKASGFVARALAKSGNANVPVAPPAVVK